MPPRDASELDRLIVERLAVSYEEHKNRHGELLAQISAQAMRSPIYSGRIRQISSVDDLGSLPLTSYEFIDRCTEREGLEKVLLAPARHSFHTSGSTGTPKGFHYGDGDCLRIATEYAMFSRIIGAGPGKKAWNMAGRLPDVSGYMFDQWMKYMGMDDSVSTPLKDDRDIITALRRISSEKNIDIIACTPLVLYLVGRMAEDPSFLHGSVESKAMRSYHIPRSLAKLVRRIYLRGIDANALKDIASNLKISFTFAEPLNPYLSDLERCYPKLQTYDVYGSTENPLMAVQMDRSVNGLGMFINTIIPEIAPQEEVLKARDDPLHPVPGVPWSDWKAGMVGELIITRPGECLPLIRYPTGDVIEILEGAHEVNAVLDGITVSIQLPLIRVLGRSVESLDFEAEDEMGNFMGTKIYSRVVNEALGRSNNVRWWELYRIRERPTRLAIVVIPESDPADVGRYKAEVLRRLTGEQLDLHHSFRIANEMGKLEIIVVPAQAYVAIQAEIDRRVREGRSYGQLKPKRIYAMAGEEEFRKVMREKYGL